MPPGLTASAPDHFDIVIVDEFHHAAAPSYRALLEHVRPARAAGAHRDAGTQRRPAGTGLVRQSDRRRAASVGCHRPASARPIRATTASTTVWTCAKCRGGEVGATTSTALEPVHCKRRLGPPGDPAGRARVDESTRCARSGFASASTTPVHGARFQRGGHSRRWLCGATARTRSAGRSARDLAGGRRQRACSPSISSTKASTSRHVDTLLLLRPTDSPTLFLQQLGRGLRVARQDRLYGVGLRRPSPPEFRFDRRFRALLGGGRRDVESEIDAGFPFLPAGCHMELTPLPPRSCCEASARRSRRGGRRRWKSSKNCANRRALTLPEFLDDTGLELSDVYSGGRTWSDLCEAAGAPTRASGPREADLRRAVGRMLHIDDEQRISVFRALLDLPAVPPSWNRLPRWRSDWHGCWSPDSVRCRPAGSSLQDALDILWAHPQVRVEIARHARRTRRTDRTPSRSR